MKTWAKYVRPSETVKDLSPGFEIKSPNTAETVKNFHQKIRKLPLCYFKTKTG